MLLDLNFLLFIFGFKLFILFDLNYCFFYLAFDKLLIFFLAQLNIYHLDLKVILSIKGDI